MAAPVQVGLAGPKRVKVTVPVGVGAGTAPPVTVATSETGLPMVTGAADWVAMVAVGAGAGATAPVTVATSEIGLPMVTVGVAWVVMVPRAWLTTDDSLVAPHGLVTVV